MKVSIAIPYYSKMKNANFFMARLLKSIEEQTYKDIEVIITSEGNAAENTNLAMRKCTGGIIKVMYMDDYFTHKDSLKDIVEGFPEGRNWLIAGCNNNLEPKYTGDILQGNNKLGGPSALAIRRASLDFLNMKFDEELKWVFDCDYYYRMYRKYGEPVILNGDYITVGEGDHQATNLLTNEEKEAEIRLLRQKYV
jgi:hypothetical protein